MLFYYVILPQWHKKAHLGGLVRCTLEPQGDILHTLTATARFLRLTRQTVLSQEVVGTCSAAPACMVATSWCAVARAAAAAARPSASCACSMAQPSSLAACTQAFIAALSNSVEDHWSALPLLQGSPTLPSNPIGLG